MAKAKIPDPLERRHLIERDFDPARALRTAEAYLAEDRVVEAIEFLRKAGATERLEELRADAVKTGDAFLLRSLASALEVPPTQDEWRALGEVAQQTGKERYAAQARRQAERGED